MTHPDILQMAQRARRAARQIANTTTAQRNAVLARIQVLLSDDAHQQTILAANAIDISRGEAAGLRPALLDRMLLTPQRLAAIASDIGTVIALPDPVGDVFERGTLPN
ncbi:MAG: gamma-glutamyl-phosphate reductase, partial [Roseiflexaceae bacterium]